MKNKVVKKLVSILILFITLLSFGGNNFVSAVSLNNAYIEQVGTATPHLKYNGRYVQVSVVGHHTNGVFYPAYCLNHNLNGAEHGAYNVSISQILDNDAVWRVVTNGFPYKTAAEMGLQTDFDAFAVTKMAIYCVTGQSDLNAFSADSNDGTALAMLSVLHNLVNIGFNGQGSQAQGTLSASKIGEVEESGNYYSQRFTANSGVGLANYSITHISGFPEGSYIANLNGSAQNTFGPGEQFKIMIPKNAFTSDINGNIYMTGKCKVYPIFYGESGNPALQDYVVTYDPYGDDSTVVSLNIKTNTAKIQINKVDDYTKNPINGVTFELSKLDGTIIGRATTNENGIALFEHLYQGSYVVREVATNEKYILNTNDFNTTTTFNKTTTLNIENEHKKGNLKVYKVDKDYNKIVLGDVEFDLYSEEFQKVIGTYRTDVNGEIYIENLRIGNYSLIEKETNRWYNLANDTNIAVEWKETTDTTIENELMKGQIKIVKIDTDNKEVKLGGVTFEVYDENNNLLETLVTDKNGEVTTKRYAVRDFEKLYLKETSTLENYILNDKVQEIVLEANQITTISFENEKKKGEIEVIKVDKDKVEVKLEGVVFEICDEDGIVVDSIVTDSEGKAKSIRLPIDKKYLVYEKSNPNEKYVLNEEPIKVELEEDKITSITFENEVRKGQIEIIKVDAENNEVKIEGVTFEILNSNDEVVDTIITNEQGIATSKKLSIYDEYTVREKETRKEYVLSDKQEKVVLKEDEITTLTFENYKKKGSLKIVKLSDGYNELLNIADNTPLAGAKFTVTNSNDEVIGTYETNEMGYVQIDNLEYGEYKIFECEAPNSYVKSEEIQNISITEDGQIIEVTFKNSPELPQTGNNSNYFIISMSVLMVAFFSTLILKKNKDEREETKYE
ncbi:MAG: Cys-Gln thioester bond-forming surface protein [Clostridia bacterium]|nr:Cys-Gln thioester bond-forming surface protein [Clostridia bacterium]